MSMWIYLPAMSYTPFSIRGMGGGGGTGLEYATQWSFSLGEMLTFLIPSFYGFGGATYWGSMPFTDYPNYMGIIVFAFAAHASFNALQLCTQPASVSLPGGLRASSQHL